MRPRHRVLAALMTTMCLGVATTIAMAQPAAIRGHAAVDAIESPRGIPHQIQRELGTPIDNKGG